MSELVRVACVDDDEFIREIIALSLMDVGGLQAEVFAEAEAALAGMEGFAPQLMLLDMMMPGMTGLELMGRLRARPALADTPVVFMTAKAQAHELEAYRAAGASATIIKPFDPVTLPDQLRTIYAGGDAPAAAAI